MEGIMEGKIPFIISTKVRKQEQINVTRKVQKIMWGKF